MAGCATHSTIRPAKTADLLSAQQALFRHQIAKMAPPGSEYSTICISTDGDSPSADPLRELVESLQDITPPVKPWSACRWNDVRPIDVATGKPAVQVRHKLLCGDADHCAGPGGYAYGNLGAEVFDYVLERRNGQWIVSERLTAIS